MSGGVPAAMVVASLVAASFWAVWTEVKPSPAWLAAVATGAKASCSELPQPLHQVTVMPFVAGFAAALPTGAALPVAAVLAVAPALADGVVLFWLVTLAEVVGADPVPPTDAVALVAAVRPDGGAAALVVALTEAAPPHAASKPAAAPPLKRAR